MSDDTPIEDRDYSVPQVIDLNGFRIARGQSVRLPHTQHCKHLDLRYDRQERRIWCKTCERTLEAYDAFEVLVDNWHRLQRGIHSQQDAIADAAEHNMRSLAVKALDKVWSGHKQAPCCPHCRAALMPEDFAGGIGRTVSRQIEQQRRANAAKRDDRA